MQLVLARRNARNGVVARLVGNGEEFGVDRQDDAGHFRMDVAEKIGRTGAIEFDGSLRAGLVETEIEALSTIEREDIVKPGIQVGEIDNAADWNDQQARFEVFVPLNEAVASFVGHA